MIAIIIFYVIVDSLLAELKNQSIYYINLNNKFGFLTKSHALSPIVITQEALNLQRSYPDDLELTLDIECRHLSAHLRTLNTKEMSASELRKMLYEIFLFFIQT